MVDAANFGSGRTHVEINAAIASLPAGGGKVVVRGKDGPWAIGQGVLDIEVVAAAASGGEGSAPATR